MSQNVLVVYSIVFVYVYGNYILNIKLYSSDVTIKERVEE